MQKFYEEQDRECTKKQFRIIGIVVALFYLAATCAILYLKPYVFSLILQFVSLFVLTSGYLVPTLLRISQIKLEAGLKLVRVQNNRDNSREDAMASRDLSFDKGYEVSPTESNKISDNYFQKFYGDKEKKSVHPKKDTNCSSLITPYLCLIGIVACYVVILLNPIRLLLNKSWD